MKWGKTNQQCINSLRDLVLGSGDSDDVTSKLRARELNLAVPFLLQLVDLGHACQQFAMVQAIYDHTFGNILGILNFKGLEIAFKRDEGVEEFHIQLSRPCP